MKFWSLVLLVALPFMFSDASARTWYIMSDGNGDAPTIQAGIDSASVGDTVLVQMGDYIETITFKSGVVLLSESGPDSTRLQPAVAEVPIVTCIDASGEIRGFTFEGIPDVIAKAIYCERSGLLIKGNKFVRLHANSGAGVACIDGSDAQITDNSFLDTYASDAGGAIYCYNSSPVIEANHFSSCEANYGGAIWCSDGGTPLIIGNLFGDNFVGYQGGAIHCNYGCSPTIQENTFGFNCAFGAGGAVFYQRTPNSLVTGNLFYWNRSGRGGGVCVALESDVVIENNTFYENEGWYIGAGVRVNGGAAEIRRCIFANSLESAAVECEGGGTADLDCNDMWANFADYTGCSAGPNDFSACPSFCSGIAKPRDFHLCDSSPCLPGNHPEGADCGLIGALGEGCSCGPSRAEATTWGAIKSMYR